jgi:hypothetical protein
MDLRNEFVEFGGNQSKAFEVGVVLPVPCIPCAAKANGVARWTARVMLKTRYQASTMSWLPNRRGRGAEQISGSLRRGVEEISGRCRGSRRFRNEQLFFDSIILQPLIQAVGGSRQRRFAKGSRHILLSVRRSLLALMVESSLNSSSLFASHGTMPQHHHPTRALLFHGCGE